VARGRRKDNARALTKLTVTENGAMRIRADPPLIMRIADGRPLRWPVPSET
jgi:hypothetical protein